MRFEADFEAHYGITLNEGMTLCSLSKRERMCPGETLGLTPSNMSKVLRTVESKGLVEREMCCKDRRQIYYSITPQGHRLLGSLDCRAIELPTPLREWVEAE